MLYLSVSKSRLVGKPVHSIRHSQLNMLVMNNLERAKMRKAPLIIMHDWPSAALAERISISFWIHRMAHWKHEPKNRTEN